MMVDLLLHCWQLSMGHPHNTTSTVKFVLNKLCVEMPPDDFKKTGFKNITPETSEITHPF